MTLIPIPRLTPPNDAELMRDRQVKDPLIARLHDMQNQKFEIERADTEVIRPVAERSKNPIDIFHYDGLTFDTGVKTWDSTDVGNRWYLSTPEVDPPEFTLTLPVPDQSPGDIPHFEGFDASQHLLIYAPFQLDYTFQDGATPPAAFGRDISVTVRGRFYNAAGTKIIANDVVFGVATGANAQNPADGDLTTGPSDGQIIGKMWNGTTFATTGGEHEILTQIKFQIQLNLPPDPHQGQVQFQLTNGLRIYRLPNLG